MATVTLQPDGTAGLDTLITPRGATTNYGTTSALNVGEMNDDVGTSEDRSLIKFDLSSIPSTATIGSVTLSLYATEDHSSNARTFRVYRQKRAWVETQATWNIFAAANNWQTAGGFGANDCEQTEIGSRAFTATETLNTFKDWTLDPVKVQEWVSGAFSNNGMLVKSDTGSNDGYVFASSENATAANRPKLVITYKVVGLIAGVSSGTGGTTGILKGSGYVSGNSIADNNPVVDGTLKANGYLEGSSSGISVVVGNFSGVFSMESLVEGSSVVTGRLSGKITVQGQSNGVANVSASAKANVYLSGNSLGTVTIISAIIAIGRIQGSSVGSSTATLSYISAGNNFNNIIFQGMSRGIFKSMR